MLLALLLLFAVDFISSFSSSSSSSTAFPVTVSSTKITTTTPLISTNTSTSTSTSTVSPVGKNQTYSFHYASKKSTNNHTEPSGLIPKKTTEKGEDDLAEAESSSYALDEDEDDDNDFDSQADGFDDSSSDNSNVNFESHRNNQISFDTLNDLLTRSVISPEAASTTDHYQILNNRSASLKDFYEALSDQDPDLDSDSGSASLASSLSATNTAALDDQASDGDDSVDDGENVGRNTIRLPSITTIVNRGEGAGKDLENRQDFLFPGSSSSSSSSEHLSSPTSSNFNYHRQQQLALYHQLSQMVQNSIASARGAGIGNSKTKGNSYVAAPSTAKKSSAASTTSTSGGGKSKKLQIVYIKVNMCFKCYFRCKKYFFLNLSEKMGSFKYLQSSNSSIFYFKTVLLLLLSILFDLFLPF